MINPAPATLSSPIAPAVLARKIAVLLPCFNEAPTIGRVVRDFQAALPGADIYVYDNNSTDRTAEIGVQAGAHVRYEYHQGKGHVVRRMLADIDADIYVLADGDATYDAAAALLLISRLVHGNLDMVVAARAPIQQSAYRSGHRFGNLMFNRLVRGMFGGQMTDVFSGYRVFSKRFAKSFPATSAGFEIEAELSVHALDLKLAVQDITLPYGARPAHSHSKLNTWRDGARIFFTLLQMYRALYPLRFFGGAAVALASAAILLGVPLLVTFLETGLVPRLPTAVLCMGLAQIAMLSAACGFIIEEIARSRRDAKRLRYLQLPSLAASASPHA